MWLLYKQVPVGVQTLHHLHTTRPKPLTLTTDVIMNVFVTMFSRGKAI